MNCVGNLFMVSIIKKTINNKIVYYLHHTLRIKSSFKSKEKYLGHNIPKNITDLKIDFFKDIYKDKFDIIEKLKSSKNLNYNKQPSSIKTKELINFSINFTYNTNRIEGSTLNLKDSYTLLEEGIVPEKKKLKDIKETEAHQKLFLKLFNTINSNNISITYKNILKWHNELFKDTKPDVAGKIRNYQVGISQSKYVPPYPTELEYELDNFFKWYNNHKSKYHPIILSALVHLKFIAIHPFGDGNGRLSRILMNVILFNNKYPLFIIDYNDRHTYYSSLEKSQVNKDDIPFLTWFLNKYIKFIK